MNQYPISNNPDVVQEGQERIYEVKRITTDLNQQGFVRVETQGFVKITVNGETPVNFNPNGIFVDLETVGETLEALENLTAQHVSDAMGGKPVATITFSDFYQVALAQGIAGSDANGRFNVS